MTQQAEITPAQVEKAAEFIIKLRPFYSELLVFYQAVFMAQEEAKQTVRIEAKPISKDMLKLKLKEKFPLVSVSDFELDEVSCRQLFEKISRIIREKNPGLKSSAEVLIAAMDKGDLKVEDLCRALLAGNDSVFEKYAEELKVDKKLLAFIAYNSVKPSLVVFAEKTAQQLEPDYYWGKGYCPVCGSAPAIAVLQGEGERFLRCGFCGHSWSAMRIYCPFCENKDSKTLSYFYSESEPEYRVDICEACNKYIKTVDLRKLSRDCYMPLEQVATLHLDLKAQEMGLESGTSLYLEP
ncbi:MAG: formate dehydrogenase accessory protein FdhE [Desulfobacterales bacterium]